MRIVCRRLHVVIGGGSSIIGNALSLALRSRGDHVVGCLRDGFNHAVGVAE